MKPQVREHALRSIVAALLSSGLPADDIRETAELLTSDPDFAQHFTAMLDAVLSQLPPPRVRSRPAPANGTSSSHTVSNSNVDEVIRILESFRITNKELITQLQTHPALTDWHPRPQWSRRKIIESIVERVPPGKLPEVLATVTVGRGSVDPWMEALAARGRKGNGRY